MNNISEHFSMQFSWVRGVGMRLTGEFDDQGLDDALDTLYDFVDACLDRDEFRSVDRMLSECAIESAPHVILVGMISTTFCAAKALDSTYRLG